MREVEAKPQDDLEWIDCREWLERRLKEVEWQVPARTESETEELNAFLESNQTSPRTIFNFALKALWRNWIDSLETAIKALEQHPLDDEAKLKDVEYMSHKLEFTRIRQDVIVCCATYHENTDLGSFVQTAELLGKRCDALAHEQSDDMASALPGLIPRRDTMMLRSRIDELVSNVTRLHNHTAVQA